MRCTTCSNGIPLPGERQCTNCRPTPYNRRTAEDLANLHRDRLAAQEAKLAQAAARDPHYQADLDRVRDQLAALNAEGVSA